MHVKNYYKNIMIKFGNILWLKKTFDSQVS